MKCTGFNLCKGDKGQNLLTVFFQDEDRQKEWIPKWEDVCNLGKNAVLTEAINTQGQWNDYMRHFLETANFIRRVCRYVEGANDVKGAGD